MKFFVISIGLVMSIGFAFMLTAIVSTAQGQGGQRTSGSDDLRLEELPESVRETVTREVRNGTIEDIERDREKGQTVYEVEFRINGQEYEIDVAPDGTLLERHAD